MRCRRICRELLWLARFGEFGPSSQPHLDHLAGCQGCRDEVGFDRAMVDQLRIALAARIEHASPSSSAWDRILARAQSPEPRRGERLLGWSTALLARLRFATAMAGTGLALVLALNMEVIPVGVPVTDGASSDGESGALQQVPRVPPVPSALEQLVDAWGGPNQEGAARPDPEAAMVIGRVPQPTAASIDQPVESQLRIVFRATQTPEPEPAGVSAAIQTEGTTSSPSGSEPGVPS